MSAPVHTPTCPTLWKPPRKPGRCTCGVARDKWLETARQLENAIRRSR